MIRSKAPVFKVSASTSSAKKEEVDTIKKSDKQFIELSIVIQKKSATRQQQNLVGHPYGISFFKQNFLISSIHIKWREKCKYSTSAVKSNNSKIHRRR